MSKVLIIDDDQNTTHLLELILARDGYETRAVNDGHGAVAAAISYQPDLILLDLMMPVIDGFEICRSLRADSQFSHTAILFFTAKGDLDTQMAGFRAGADGFLQKPVHPKELKLKINALVSSGRVFDR